MAFGGAGSSGAPGKDGAVLTYGVGRLPACPVCGAAGMSCGGTAEGPRGAIGTGMFLPGGPTVPDFPHRSRQPVYEPDPRSPGLSVQKYGIGTPIPLAEALRQGVASWEQLTEVQRAALARHGILPPEPTVSAKAPDAPPKDKMVRRGQVVRKG